MKKKIMRVMVLLLAVLCCACAGTAKEDEEIVFTVNCYNGNYVSATTQIMQQEKILEKYLPENVELRFTSLVSGPEIRDGILAGDIQIADLSLMTFQTGLENGLPLRLVSFSGSTPIRLYANDPLIDSLETLQGPVTITNRVTNLHAAYLAAVAEEGLDLGAYDALLVPTPNTEALALLEAGTNVKASVLSFPTYSKAETMGNVTLVSDFSEVIAAYSIGSAFVAHADFYEAHPKIIEAFRKAQEEVLGLFRSEPERMAQILAELYQIDVTSILAVIETMPPTSSLAGYDVLGALLYKSGLLSEEPHPFSELPNHADIAELGK